MKAVAIMKYGSKELLQPIEAPTPNAGDYEVLVEVHAASVNPIDYKIRDGKAKLILSFRFPLILGHDFAGKVVGVGAKVTRFKVGDQVYGRPHKSRIGTFAQYVAVHEDEVALKPANLSMEEAAGIPLIGLTAWQALHDIIHLKPGQKILIHAGSGGVGTFAIQLAKQMGAYVATTTSETNLELVQSLGADEAINYRKERFEEKLAGYDAVLDTVGEDTLNRSFQVLKPGGQLVTLSGMPDKRFAVEAKLGWVKTVLFSMISKPMMKLAAKYNVTYRYVFMQPNGEQLKSIAKLIEQGDIKPVVDRIFPFDQTQEAVAYLEKGRAKGKVVVRVKG